MAKTPSRRIEPLERTLHKTHEWLTGLMRVLGTNDRRTAYRALRAVLHALRDRLPVGSVAHLGAQLPLLVRGIYYDGWHPGAGGKPTGGRSLDAFLDRVERELPGRNADPESATRGVFALLEQHVDAGEIEKVIHVLPRPIQALWRTPVEPDAD